MILVAAGRGERLGAGIPKGFVEVGGQTLLERGVRTIAALPHAGHLVVVVPDDWAGRALELVDEALPAGTLWETSVVHGGRERHESVRFGIEALPAEVGIVLVHDAARPLAGAPLFERVLAEVRRTGDSVVPALPVADTLKRVDGDGIVHETVDRSALVAVQTPQGFRREALESAHATAALHAEHGSGAAGAGSGSGAGSSGVPTDDAEVMQRAGGRVRTVAGEMRAHKLTTAADHALLEALAAQDTQDEKGGRA